MTGGKKSGFFMSLYTTIKKAFPLFWEMPFYSIYSNDSAKLLSHLPQQVL
ncbi:Uncharacterized protein dnm_096260 [Desulfonema magnum]|uniref:Uncharacterized protein n=1 Tax=Desulfonema magnum TaxID=45655 RepID=A0A975GTW1_9BACT|nr:Uncharacterized protein dnm_096260 [Desulfonema magnum]